MDITTKIAKGICKDECDSPVTLSFRPHIKVHSSDKVVPVLSVTFTSFWIIAAVGSVDEISDDSREEAVKGAAIVVVVVVVVDVVVIGNFVARGLPQISLRLPFNPPFCRNPIQ